MFLRTAAIVCATAMIASLSAPAVADVSAPATTARCEEMAFRVYFDHNSAALTPLARETLNTAQRNVAGCSYAELHVAIGATSGYAARRGRAIVQAMNGRNWNLARVETRSVTPISAGPEYAEVVMTPRALGRAPTNNATSAGV